MAVEDVVRAYVEARVADPASYGARVELAILEQREDGQVRFAFAAMAYYQAQSGSDWWGVQAATGTGRVVGDAFVDVTLDEQKTHTLRESHFEDAAPDAERVYVQSVLSGVCKR